MRRQGLGRACGGKCTVSGARMAQHSRALSGQPLLPGVHLRHHGGTQGHCSHASLPAALIYLAVGSTTHICLKWSQNSFRKMKNNHRMVTKQPFCGWFCICLATTSRHSDHGETQGGCSHVSLPSAPKYEAVRLDIHNMAKYWRVFMPVYNIPMHTDCEQAVPAIYVLIFASPIPCF